MGAGAFFHTDDHVRTVEARSKGTSCSSSSTVFPEEVLKPERVEVGPCPGRNNQSDQEHATERDLKVASLEERVCQLEAFAKSQTDLVMSLQREIRNLEKEVPSTVSVLQYNILASYLGMNTQPWFLYGAELTPEKRSAIMAKYYERDESGRPRHVWPSYAAGLLTAEEIAQVEKHDTFFRWVERKDRLVEVIQQYDADIISLVELDQHDFFHHRLGDVWDSVFHKRPRDASLDGCGVFWRRSKFAVETSEAFDFVDSQDMKGRKRRDRSVLMVLLRWKVHKTPLVVVSTHLARDPEDRAQTAIRVRQVNQLVEWLTLFTDTNKVSDAPVVLLGDLNSQHFGEIRGIARTVWQIKGEPMHPFLWSASDVSTGPTSITKARQVRIDIVQYTSSQLEVLDVAPVPKLRQGEVIPSAQHPSDHFPVCVRFRLKDSYTKHKEYARAWLECVAGRQRVHPLTEVELQIAFDFFDRDRSSQIHRHDLEEACLELSFNVCADVQGLLLGCFPDNQISYPNFVKAYEARLNSSRVRCIGDLEYAFDFIADGSKFVSLKSLQEAFRDLTPISFSDEEVDQMIGKLVMVSNVDEDNSDPAVDLHKFCEVVCQASFPHRDRRRSSRTSTAGVSGAGSPTAGRDSTKDLFARLDRFHQAVYRDHGATTSG